MKAHMIYNVCCTIEPYIETQLIETIFSLQNSGWSLSSDKNPIVSENNNSTIEAQLISVNSALKIAMMDTSVFPASLNISEGGS